MQTKNHIYINDDGNIYIDLNNKRYYRLPIFRCSTKEKAEKELHEILIKKWSTDQILEDVARAIRCIWHFEPDIPF